MTSLFHVPLIMQPNDWLKSRDPLTASVFLDGKKAFDIQLIIAIMGCGKHSLDWFCDFLQNRRQWMKLNRSASCFGDIRRIVSQGSKLAHLLLPYI